MLHRSRTFVAGLALLGLVACTPDAAPVAAPDLAAERAAVDSVLTALHQSASSADWNRYFDLYAPDAVFFGTDATERWNLDEFRGYATASNGWTYTPTERHIFLDADANTAWFDERLENASYGETRGTGVLVKGDSGWKISPVQPHDPDPQRPGESVRRADPQARRGAVAASWPVPRAR